MNISYVIPRVVKAAPTLAYPSTADIAALFMLARPLRVVTDNALVEWI
jgi:hypothetical protein